LLIFRLFDKIWKVGKSWQKLAKVGKSWQKLAKVGKSWQKLDGIIPVVDIPTFR